MNAFFKSSALQGIIRNIELPVSCTNVASIVCWNTTAVDDDSKDNKARAGDDLHDGEDEFHLLQLARSSERIRPT